MDSTLWVAALTGGTAVLASWVTSRGTARAARIQVEASSRAQQLERIRESRRAAYVDVIAHAHRAVDLHFQAKSTLMLFDTDTRAPLIKQARDELREAFSPLMRSVQLTALAGPVAVAEAAEELQESLGRANRALHSVQHADEEAPAAYESAEADFRRRLECFTATAREAVASIE